MFSIYSLKCHIKKKRKKDAKIRNTQHNRILIKLDSRVEVCVNFTCCSALFPTIFASILISVI